MESLTPQQIIAFFEKEAKTKQEKGVEESVLKWNAQNISDI